MNLRQKALIDPHNSLNQAKGVMRLRGGKKEIEQFSYTPETEILKGKETLKKKLNKQIDSKIEDFYDIHGNDQTFISDKMSTISDFSQNDTQCSISSVSTNTTLDYERMNQAKNLKFSSDFSVLSHKNNNAIDSNSNTILVEQKVYKIDIQQKKNEQLDFKQFLDEQQQIKLKKEDERKATEIQQQLEKKNNLKNVQKFLTTSTVSNTNQDLIKKILNKSENGQNTVKLDIISKKLHQNHIKSQVEIGNKMIDESKINENKQKQEQEQEQEQEQAFSSLTETVILNKQQKSVEPNSIALKETTYQRLYKNQNNERVEKIMAQPSIKQKYEELIKGDSIQFTLPYQYKYLLNSFEKLDECIRFFKDRNKPTFFNELKNNMEQAMCSTISQKQLLQILYLYPQAYQLKWVKHDEKWHLSINIASDENEKRELLTNEDRCSKLKQLLIEKVKFYHSIYLKETGIQHYENELLENCVWHECFDIQNVPDIEQQSLPLKPYEIKVESQQDTLQKDDAKNKLLASLMKTREQEQQEKEQKKKELIESSFSISTKDNKTGLNDRLYQLIKAKEQKLNEEKISMQLNKLPNGKISMASRSLELKKIVEIINIYYVQRKVSNIFYVNLVEHIQQTKALIISKKDIIEFLDFLIQTFPYWITLIANKQGNIVRLDKTIVPSRILLEIEKLE